MGRPVTNKYRYKDKLMTISELMVFSVVSEDALRKRLYGEWRVDDAVETPNIPKEKQGFRQRSSNPAIINRNESKSAYKRYASCVTKASKAKGETNKKLEDLIEKRRLEKELDDY